MKTDYDVVVVGGGIVGSALALLLVRGAGFAPGRVAVLEREPTRDWQRDAPPDLRTVALSRASERILAAAGVWSQIAAARIGPYERMHVWHGDDAPRGPHALRFDAAEMAEPDLGAIVENGLVQSMLQRQLHQQGIAIRQLAVERLQFNDDGVQLQAGDTAITTRLLVGADGARSAVRRLAGLWMTDEDYGQTALVANVRSEQSHERTAWQRFLGEGSLALLPLASGASSIVWSLPSARTRELLAMPVADFDRALTADSAGVLGGLTLDSARAGFPLHRMSAQRYVLERCALAGDAAHVVHPLAGQGLNLGLADVAALVGVINQREPWRALGDEKLLRRYARERAAPTWAMGRVTDGLLHLFSHEAPMSRELRNRGLTLVNRLSPLKRWLTAHALDS